MTKKLIVIIGLLFGLFGFSQENTASPYSFYGIGEVRFKGTIAEKTMGSLAITGDSIAVNLLNPASYSHLKLTNFSVGGTSTFNNLQNETDSEKAKRTSLDYLTISIPMGKFGASVGLVPYSAVGYKIRTRTTTDNNDYYQTLNSTGKGNLNKFYLGTAYSVNNNLSIGVNFEYNFGVFENQVTEKNYDSFNIRLSSRELNTTKLNGVNLNFGLLYNKKVSSKLYLFNSATFRPESKLNGSNQRNIATTLYSPSGVEYISQQNDVTLPDSKIIIPTKFSLGTGIGEKNKWLLGADFSFVNSKKQNNVFDTDTDYSYKNGQTVAIGGYYIPDYDSFSSYLNRIVYRAGFRYENTGLVVKNNDINNYGMNFGLGLPLGNSKLDLGFEFGKRGTTTNNLIQENYFNLSVGISISDKWFRKILID